MRRIAGLVAAVTSLMVGASAVAADLPTKKEPPAPLVAPAIPSTWQFEITGYAWASSVAGSTGYAALPETQYYASFLTLLQHLQGALSGTIIARNDAFIFGLDALWSRIGGGGTIRKVDTALYGGQADLTLNEGFVTAFGGVKIPLAMPNLDLYGTAGLRYFVSGTKLSVSGPFGIGTSTSVNKDWLMPVAGLTAQYRFDDRWFMNVLADIGGWENSATGQALASIGYKWTPHIATTLGYRVMYTYDKQDTGISLISFEPRSFRYQQWMYGPFAGLKYMF